MESTMRAKKIQYIDQNLLEHNDDHHSCVKIHETFVNYYDPQLFKTMIKATSKTAGLYSIVNFGRQELQ